MKTDYVGIDYSLGRSNTDANGIHYGVISHNSVAPEAMDDVYSDSRDLTHESAVAEIKQRLAGIESQEDLATILDEVIGNRTGYRLVCYEEAEQVLVENSLPLAPEKVESIWDAIEQAFNDRYECDNHDWLYESDGYKLTKCLDNDIFVLLSPYYTRAQFCSPCVPGAGNLDSPVDNPDAPKTYCLGHEWFESDTAPYTVYSVETNEVVQAKKG